MPDQNETVENQATEVIIEHTKEWFGLRLQHDGSAVEEALIDNDIEDCAAEITDVLRDRGLLSGAAETQEASQPES